MNQGSDGAWRLPWGCGGPSHRPASSSTGGESAYNGARVLVEAEAPKDVDVRQLAADFGVTANAIAVVVNVEQVIKDTH